MADSASGSNLPSHMKAWVHYEYGKIEEVLKFEESLALPELKHDDQVLIKVVAAALNPIDYYRSAGFFKQNDSPFPVLSFTTSFFN